MKTPEQVAAFKAEIAAVCERHRIGMAGTDNGEQIYGEITIFDMDAPDEAGWKDIQAFHLNWMDRNVD